MSEFRQAVRSILQRPAFAIMALLTITLGMGANTAVYAVVYAVLLEPLPFRQPRALVQVWETHPELHNFQVSIPDYLDWKNSLKSLNLAAYTFQAMDKATLLGPGDPVEVQGTNASSELFPLLGIRPLLGHLYGAQEEQVKEKVVLISERLWRRKFSADPEVIGRPLRLGSTSFAIVGILRQRSAFPVWADVWMPLSLTEPELYSTRKYHPLEVIGRLRFGVSLRRAQIEMEGTARQLSAANPGTNGKIGAVLVPLMDAVTGPVRPALLAVWIAVGLVLLIACTNLAHLTMGRTLDRRREIAIRLALGASRLGVFRAFLRETIVLSLAGGMLGILAAALALPLIQHLAHGRVPRFDNVAVNFPVLLFATLASLMVALLFALPAYLQVFRADLSETIASGNARGTSVRGSWLNSALMSSEVALSLAVLLAAILLVRSFSLTLRTQPGFESHGVLIVHSTLVDGDWQKSYSLFRNRITPALLAIPGVQDVAAVNSIPMSLGATEHSRYATRFGIVGRDFEPGQFPTAQLRWCTANYFHVLGLPLVRGRLLTEADRNQPRYVVSEAFAQRFFPQSNAVGQKILLGVVSPHPESAEIVGVVGDAREFGLTSAPEPVMYSLDVSPGMDVVVKAGSANPILVNAIGTAMHRINPQQAVGPVRTLDDHIADSLGQQRFILGLIAAFAGLAMSLCVVGIYGVFSYSVTRRVREFGIRSAIGARKGDLFAQVLRECLAVIIPGLFAGIALTAACSRFMRTLLYRVSPTDPFSSGLAIMLVLALCLGSVAIPALRAANVDPAITLREQ